MRKGIFLCPTENATSLKEIFAEKDARMTMVYQRSMKALLLLDNPKGFDPN